MATAKELVIIELKAQGSKQTAEELSRTADRVLEMKDEVRKLNSEINKLIPTQRNHNNRLRNSNGNYKEAAGGMRMMRGGAAQLGYQIQDVAVQLQMGQNALMVFAQQGSQVASLFGAGGAALGAILAVGAGLATYFKNAKQSTVNTKELADEVMGLKKSYNELTEAQKELLRVQHAEEILEIKDKIKEMQDQLLDAADAQRVFADMESFQPTTIQADIYARSLAVAEDRMTSLSEQTANHQGKIDNLRDRLAILNGEYTNYTNNVAGANAEVSTMIDNLLAEVDALDANKKARQEEFDVFLSGFNAEVAAIDARKKARQDEFGLFIENLNAEITAIDARTEAEKKAADERLNIFFDSFAEETRIMNERNARIEQLNNGALQSYGAMFGGIGDMMKDGSRAQQAAFAVQKGIAVAQAVMNLHKAVSEANTLPFPANFAAIAQAVATGTAAIAGVKSASFEGGGYTGMGTRSGGIDGKGGFPAILHPNETIIDHTKGQSGRPVTVNFNITANDTSGFDQLLQSRRGQIIGMINQAVNNRGRPSVA